MYLTVLGRYMCTAKQVVPRPFQVEARFENWKGVNHQLLIKFWQNWSMQKVKYHTL